MAHEIETFEDGTAAFFSAREVPWHRLGTVTDGALTVQEALKVAQLDWTVYKSDDPVQVPVLTPNGVQMVDYPGRYMTYRDHPKLGLQGLGVVGEVYTVIQNEEAFDFLNALADESGATIETAGSLLGGSQVFVTMKMPNSIVVAGAQDQVDFYLMATTSHDGSLAFTAAVTPIRVVCKNTQRLALGSAQSTWRLKHTTNVVGKVQQAREALGLTFRYQVAYEKAVDALVNTPFAEREVDAFLDTLFPVSKDASVWQVARTQATRDEVRALYHAPTQDNARGTRWAAYSAITEWADWVRPVRGKDKDEDVVRAERVLLGAANSIKDKAYALLAV